ncbi:O-methyltransferase [Actinacidiphila yeochonensis]|uniref:O-methyltransferase n=1 Tax=Actinacidiphila yeochonensis TaxID=89050 RepID=UPI000560FADF|nr:class I SAM-dependent methyltransferase [Actinacidiphila yeochonensis]
MSLNGTSAHLSGPGDLPPLVERAARTALHLDFAYSCRPEQGRLLSVLAAGARRIGETGTGCGVGLAWLVSGMRPDATAVSVERDPDRAEAASALFAGLAPQVRVECADWTVIGGHGPFDLLVLDGGGQGKDGGAPADPVALLRPGGLLVIDDFAPSGGGTPAFGGGPDSARLHWLDHPLLRTVEVPLAPDLAVLLATRRA